VACDARTVDAPLAWISSSVRSIEHERFHISAGALFGAHVCPEPLGKMRISFCELLKRDVVRDARVRNAHRTVDAPSCLEFHRQIVVEGPDAKTIADVDQGAVARARLPVATTGGTSPEVRLRPAGIANLLNSNRFSFAITGSPHHCCVSL